MLHFFLATSVVAAWLTGRSQRIMLLQSTAGTSGSSVLRGIIISPLMARPHSNITAGKRVPSGSTVHQGDDKPEDGAGTRMARGEHRPIGAW